MASIIRRTYKDSNGKIRRCAGYTIQYRDAAGKIKRLSRIPSTGQKITDKAVARQLAAQLEKAMAHGAVGLEDPYRKHRASPLAQHVTDYVAALRLSGCDEKYASNVERRLNILLRDCDWKSTDDIDAASFRRWQQKRAKSKWVGQQGDGASARTLNQFLETARAFTNWLATEGRMPGVPKGNGKMMATALAPVARIEGPAKRLRRALNDDEIARLLAVAPAERELVYRFGLATGLRRQEIEDLQWGDVRISAIKPYLQLRAEATKARRGDRVPLPVSLADALRSHKPADASDRDRVFPAVPTIEDWKADLAAAGIAYKDGQGRQVDFHAGTRKTLCTRMHRNGIPLAIAQRIMRHSDPRLTMEDYVDDEALGTADAALPEIVSGPKPVATDTAAATG